MIFGQSCFAQVLSLINRNGFDRVVKRHGGDKGSKGFTCWDQFVSMLFCQLGAAHSLREICGGLATAFGKLRHLGLPRAPKKSTLSYANSHRPWQIFEAAFYDLLGKCRQIASTKKRKFRFKNPLCSLDSTTIDLCLSMYDWAKFRRTKGAIKLHLLLDHQGCLPCWAYLSDGKKHDIGPARTLSFEPGTIVAADRAYIDYALFGKWTQAGVFFVTRAKDNMDYETIDLRPVPMNGNVLSDEVIRLTGIKAKNCPGNLRRVTVWDERRERELVILTNIFHLAASTVGSIYKERWQIENFFKALKQNLKIKTFVGTSENAVKIQIWTALIAMLMLKYMQLKSSYNWSLSNLAALFRMNLLTYRDLWKWLEDPFKIPPPPEPEKYQLTLF